MSNLASTATSELLDSAQLRKIMRDGCQRITEAVESVAMALKILDERGEDVSEFPIGLLTTLRRIYSGQMLPGVFANFQGVMLKKVSALPIPEQKAILTRDRVLLVVPREAGKFDNRQVAPNELIGAQREQVFANDHLRSESEQIIWLEAKAMKQRSVKAKTDEIYANKRKQCLVVNGVEISRDDLLRYLAQM